MLQFAHRHPHLCQHSMYKNYVPVVSIFCVRIACSLLQHRLCSDSRASSLPLPSSCVSLSYVGSHLQPGMYFVFCRLFHSSPLSHHSSVSALPVISLLLANVCIAGAGLPIHIIGEVSWETKRRRA
jgi:hypothetical protein